MLPPSETPLVDRMPSVDKHTENTGLAKSPPEPTQSVRGRHTYPTVFLKPNSHLCALNPKNQSSHAGRTRLEDIEDTDANSESRYENEDGDEYGEDGDVADEDNDWSGEDGLEELVLSVVGGDFAFAALLIRGLHRFMTSRLRSEVQSCGRHNASPKSRKRRRSSEHGDNLGCGKPVDDILSPDGLKQLMLGCNTAPGYDNIIAETFSNHSPPPPQKIGEFVSLCMAFVDRGASDLVFETGHIKPTSRDILKEMIRKACILWAGVNGLIPGSQLSSSSTDNNRLCSLADGSSTNITAPTTCALDSHAPMQTLGSNAQPVLCSHSSDTNQPLTKKSQASSP